MSVSNIDRSLNPSRIPTFIGNKTIAERVRNIFKDQIHLESPDERGVTLWAKDNQFITRAGEVVLPATSEMLLEQAGTLGVLFFPETLFVSLGHGLTSLLKEHTRKWAEKTGIPVRDGCAAIEGGNCIFTDRHLLIGASSVFFTMLHLEPPPDENFLKIEHPLEIKDEFIRAARNANFHGWSPTNGLNKDEFSNMIFRLYLTRNFPDLVLPLTIEERQEFLDGGTCFAALWEATLNQISRDLQVRREEILVLQHPALHIDLLALAGPNNTIFLNDPRLVVDAIQRHPDAAKYKALFDIIQKPEAVLAFCQNKKLLEDAGYRVIGVPGDYSPLTEDCGGQLLNGLCFELQQMEGGTSRYALLSTSITKEREEWERSQKGKPSSSRLGNGLHDLAEPFYDTLQQNDVSVIFVDCLADTQYGGLSCMTRTPPPLSRTFQSIPVDSRFLSTLISTPLKIATQHISKPSLSICDQDSQVYSMEPGAKYHRTEIPVPLTGLVYRIMLKNLLEKKQRRILPGHPQTLDLEVKEDNELETFASRS